jgi:RND family efflux transporter MFP subunit
MDTGLRRLERGHGGEGRVRGGWRVLLLAGLAGIAISACDGAPETASAPPALPVSLHRVGTAGMALDTHATGTVRLRRETPLAFVNDGRVRTVQVREGDRVRAGQMLASLDRMAIDAQAQAAAARSRQADAELRRQRELAARGWVSAARVESAVASAEAARAELSGAQFSQRFSTITAPAGGVILARLAEPGQTVAAGSPVLTLGEFSSGFVVRVPLPAGRVAGLSAGDVADVTFRDGAAPPMKARIIEIAGRADPATGTFQVEFALPADPALRSGLIADVVLSGAGAAAAGLAIPATALFSARADEGFVWRYDPASRKVGARMVRLGRVSDDGVEILSGLARGDRIVAAGVDRLSEGQAVKVVQAEAR